MKTQHPGLSSGLIFPATHANAAAGASRRGGELTWFRDESTVNTAIRTICKAAGVPEVSAHSFRRTFEDTLRLAGVPDIVRRSAAGWRSTDVQNIYATVSVDDRRAAIEAQVKVISAGGSLGGSAKQEASGDSKK